MTVTPLQMASVIGTVANDGVLMKPRLVQAVMNRATGERAEFPPTVRGQVAVKPATIALIKEALADVVTKGTATEAKSSLVTIAGKTGTAQTAALRTGPEKDIPKKFRDHAWFVAFAPVEAPRIAVAVLAEHMGHGGSAAAPLAKDVIETYVKAYPQVLNAVPAGGRIEVTCFGNRITAEDVMIDRVIDSRGLDSFDLRFMGLIAVILSVGVLSIYSVTHAQDTAFPFYLKQLVWILLGTVAFLVMYLSDYHKIARLAYPTYAVILILLAVVLVMGKSSRGAQRWIPIGPFAFQPSEFAKLVLVLVSGQLLLPRLSSGLAAACGLAGLDRAAGAVVDSETAGPGQRLEFSGRLRGHAADGRGAFEGARASFSCSPSCCFRLYGKWSGPHCTIISDSASWRLSIRITIREAKAITHCNPRSLSAQGSCQGRGSMAARKAS